MPGAEKFGNMAVDRSKAVVGLALEQFGRSGEPKQIGANSVTFIYCGVILARLSETRRVAGRAREQLHGVQSTSRVQKFPRRRRMNSNRTRLSCRLMFFIVSENHLMAGLLERVQTAFQPASVICDRLDQQIQALRIRQESIYSPLRRLCDEFVSVVNVRGRLQNFSTSEFVSGSRRNDATLEFGETDFRFVRSFFPSQSACRQDRRNRGFPSVSRHRRISSNGVRASDVPARTSSSPSMNRVLSPTLGMSSHVESEKITGTNQITVFRRFGFDPECGRLAGTGITEQHVGRRIPKIS